MLSVFLLLLAAGIILIVAGIQDVDPRRLVRYAVSGDPSALMG